MSNYSGVVQEMPLSAPARQGRNLSRDPLGESGTLGNERPDGGETHRVRGVTRSRPTRERAFGREGHMGSAGAALVPHHGGVSSQLGTWVPDRDPRIPTGASAPKRRPSGFHPEPSGSTRDPRIPRGFGPENRRPSGFHPGSSDPKPGLQPHEAPASPRRALASHTCRGPSPVRGGLTSAATAPVGGAHPDLGRPRRAGRPPPEVDDLPLLGNPAWRASPVPTSAPMCAGIRAANSYLRTTQQALSADEFDAPVHYRRLHVMLDTRGGCDDQACRSDRRDRSRGGQHVHGRPDRLLPPVAL